MKKTSEILEPATYSEVGKGVYKKDCHCCDYHDEEEYIIPKEIYRSSSNSNSSSLSDGSSDSDSSSSSDWGSDSDSSSSSDWSSDNDFGGGDSGGGGAGGDW